MSMTNNIKNPKQIFIINGSGGVGKDLFVDMVKSSVTKLSPNGEIYRVWNYSSIDKVKSIAAQIGWNGGKTEKDRKFLSDLKVLTTEYNDMPFADLKRMVNIFKEQKDVVFLFLHIREPKEIERAKIEFDAYTILVTRDSVPQITSNIADGGVFGYEYDMQVTNNGTKEDLKELAELFAKDWLNR